jgi:hypothetical protein
LQVLWNIYISSRIPPLLIYIWCICINFVILDLDCYGHSFV